MCLLFLTLPLPSAGQTKNWIALEDSLQRCNEPDEIKSHIASSALRTPNYLIDEKNVFAIYVSYYVKVKLTLSGMGGELSLKLPFTLAHFLQDQERQEVEAKDTQPQEKDNGQKEEEGEVEKKKMKERPVAVAQVESHRNTNNNYHNNHGSCSSSSSSAAAGAATKPLLPITTREGQVTRDSNEEEGDLEAEAADVMIPPSIACCSALRQRRFSQARQERIRPADDSLDRIETLSDDGDVDVGVEGHGTAAEGEQAREEQQEEEAERRGIRFHSHLQQERKLTTSSGSLDETELLDEVFGDTLVMGQPQQEEQGEQKQQEMGFRATKTSSSVSTSSSSSAVRGSCSAAAVGHNNQQKPIVAEEQQPLREFQKEKEEEEGEAKSTTLVQIHAPHS